MDSIGLQALFQDAEFQKGVARYSQSIASAEKMTAHAGGAMSSALSGIGGTILRVGEIASGVLLAGGISKLFEMGTAAVQTGVEFDAMKEQALIAFETMLGSGEKAKTFLDDLQQFAAATPFEFPELVAASKKLVAFGVDAKDVLPTLTKLGDLSAGVGVSVDELADLYGKAKVQGRAFSVDINQLTGRGIPIIQELAKQFGVTDDKVMKLVEDGKVGFPQIEKAITSLTAKGSKFGGLMDKQSKSFKGLWSTVQDTYTQLSGKVMQPFFDLMTEGLQTIVDFTSTPEFTKWTDDLAAGVEDFIRAGLLPFLKDTWTFLNTSIIPTVTSLVNIFKLLTTGDFSGGIFGLTEDSLFIGALLTAREVVTGLFNTLSKGDWRGAWETVAGGAANIWELINDQVGDPGTILQGWAATFWDWLTGPSGVLSQVGGKLEEARVGIVNWLKEHGPETWDTLVDWATDFWNWLTGPEGALLKAGTELQTVSTRIATGLGDEWKNTVAPALNQWGTDFWKWLEGDGGVLDQASAEIGKISAAFVKEMENPEAKILRDNAGYYAGVDFVNGIVRAFDNKDVQQTGGNAFQRFINSLLAADKANSAAFLKAGGDLAGSFFKGMTETGTPYLVKLLEGWQKIIKDWVAGIAQTIAWTITHPLMPMPVPGGGGGTGGFGGPADLPTGGGLGTGGGIGPGMGGSTVPASNAFPRGGGGAGMVQGIPMSLQVLIGGEEIQNAALNYTYDATAQLMDDAVAGVNQNLPR